ncbi:MAG: hypothetical protein CR986_10300 [Ignavibacteriae bacterium]|nr:MAG: hypothetical protein CR986_10300 [Ignavibacteriota bacterium]
MIYTKTMNSEILIKFIKQLIKGKTKKIFLILDNLKVHHSKLIKGWLEEHKDKIEVFYLPSYSPEKNLNCDLKYGLSDKPASKNQEQLRNNVQNYMEILQNNQMRVENYFKHIDIKYVA